MTRYTILAAASALALLAGCGRTAGQPDGKAQDEAATANDMNDMAVEDLPSDSLAAPSDVPLDSESNGTGSASGGNAL